MLFILLGMGLLFILGISVCYAGAVLIIDEQIDEKYIKWLSLIMICLLGLFMLIGLSISFYKLHIILNMPNLVNS